MPFIRITSNAKRASVAVDSALKAVSKTVTLALGSPEPSIMVDVQLDRDMCFQGSTELCALIEVRNIGKINAERNPTTVAALTETVAREFAVPTNRVFVNLDDISAGNWGAFGKVLG